MKKTSKILISIFIILMSGVLIISAFTIEGSPIYLTTSMIVKRDEGSVKVSENFDGSGNKLLENEEFVRYIPKGNENTKLIIDRISIDVLEDRYYRKDLEKGDGNNSTYLIEEDNSGYYIKAKFSEYKKIRNVYIDYVIKDSVEEYNNNYYITHKVYDNSKNSIQLGKIRLETNEKKITGKQAQLIGIWVKGGKFKKVVDSYSIIVDMKIDKNQSIDVLREYKKDIFLNTKSKLIPSIDTSNWIDVYEKAKEYSDFTMYNSSRRGIGDTIVDIFTMILFGVFIVIVPKVLGSMTEGRGNNVRTIKWPKFILPSYVAVATDQSKYTIGLTMILELINRNVLIIDKSRYYSCLENYDSYVVKVSATYNKQPQYLEEIILKINELSKEKELNIVELKDLLSVGYFEEAYIKCKNSYEKLEPIDIEKWNKYKGKILYSDIEDYKSMDNYSIAFTHLYSVATGIKVNEILKYINSQYHLESPYISMLLMRNNEDRTIADFFVGSESYVE